MAELKIGILGQPVITLRDREVVLSRRKAVALIAYLAVAAEPKRRETLAALLWPDLDRDRALAALRRTLRSVRKHLGPQFILADRNAIGLNLERIWVDALLLRQTGRMLEQAGGRSPSPPLEELRSVVQLYRGELLEGLVLSEVDGFEEWLMFQRESLRRDLFAVIDRLVEGLKGTDSFDEAIRFLQRRLELDPYAEEAHRELMSLYFSAGLRSMALQQFQKCARLLREELGVFPEPRTLQLFESIRKRPPAKSVAEPNGAEGESAEPATAAFPDLGGPFIGRRAELERIEGLLADPVTRLVTIVGPGGVGKTRLAREVARQQAGRFQHGLHFIPLEDVPGSSFLVKLAESLSPGLERSPDLFEGLAKHLTSRHVLLVLDNFEHLAPQASVLSRLLARAARLKMVVTSRRRLNLREEWLLELSGLDTPSISQPESLEEYGAVQFFVSSARRVRPEFALTSENGKSVAEICRRLDGLPLALELTSNWLRVLDCGEILERLRKDSAFLDSGFQDLPERHRGLVRVFESSLRLLSEEERAGLFRLSVLRGFTAPIAQKVADTDALTLMSLTDQSLLYRSSSGRFAFHGLLRRFAREGLAKLPAERLETERRHCEVFLEMLSSSGGDREGQERSLKLLRQERENMRAAWLWAVRNRSYALLDRSLEGLASFYSLTSSYSEGERLLRIAHSGVQKWTDLPLRYRILSRFGEFQTFLGRLSQAQESLEESQRFFEAGEQERELALVLMHLGNVFYHRGEFRAASRLLDRSLHTYRDLEDRSGTANALIFLSRVHGEEGNYRAAGRCLEEANQLFEQLSDRGGMARCQINLGSIALLSGRLEEAAVRFGDSLRISEELQDKKRIAVCLSNLGLVYQKRGEADRALGISQRAFSVFQAMGLTDAAARSLENMALAAMSLGDNRAALNHLTRALDLTREIESDSVSLIVLTALAQLLIRLGQQAQAAELLAYVETHPKVPDEARRRALEIRSESGLQAPAPAQRESSVPRNLSGYIDHTIRFTGKKLKEQAARQIDYSERRRHRRILGSVACRILWGRHRLSSRTFDLSLGGARILAPEPSPRENSRIQLVFEKLSEEKKLSAVVRHLDLRLFPHSFGIEFLQPLPGHDLHSLVAV